MYKATFYTVEPLKQKKTKQNTETSGKCAVLPVEAKEERKYPRVTASLSGMRLIVVFHRRVPVPPLSPPPPWFPWSGPPMCVDLLSRWRNVRTRCALCFTVVGFRFPT